MLANEWPVIAGKWADKKIEEFPYKSSNEYSSKSTVFENVIVDPIKIVGSDHPNYAGSTWRTFLSTGKRISANICRYEENPFYFGSELQSHSHYGHWTLAQIGEVYFICEGNHRSLIAKFLACEKGMRSQIVPKVIRIAP